MAIFSAIGSSHKMNTCLPGPSNPFKPSHSSAGLTYTNTNTHAYRHAQHTPVHAQTCALTHLFTHVHSCTCVHEYTHTHLCNISILGVRTNYSYEIHSVPHMYLLCSSVMCINWFGLYSFLFSAAWEIAYTYASVFLYLYAYICRIIFCGGSSS